MTGSVAAGARWALLTGLVAKLGGPVFLVVLARILAPEDFGLMAVAMVVIAFAALFQDLGLKPALVQRKEASEDLLRAVFWVLERNPGGLVIYDVKCTRHLDRIIREHGGEPLMWKTGHSFIKAKIRESGALLAGEMSGHIFIKERWYGFDDALYAAARLLEILGKDMRSSTEIFAELPDSVNTPELNVPMREGEPQDYIGRLLENAHFENATVSTIDGMRVDFADGWGLVRASNTTPVLVLRFEADNDAALRRIMEEFRRTMLQVKSDLSLPF